MTEKYLIEDFSLKWVGNIKRLLKIGLVLVKCLINLIIIERDNITIKVNITKEISIINNIKIKKSINSLDNLDNPDNPDNIDNIEIIRSIENINNIDNTDNIDSLVNIVNLVSHVKRGKIRNIGSLVNKNKLKHLCQYRRNNNKQ